jgi:hypothetical protein
MPPAAIDISERWPLQASKFDPVKTEIVPLLSYPEPEMPGNRVI